MNRKSLILILLPLLLAACVKSAIEEPAGLPPASSETSDVIDASCSVAGMNGTSSGSDPGIATKAIIGQGTIVSLDANFIKLDEAVTSGWKQEDYVMKPFAGWDDPQTRILDASILSSPDNTKGIHLRSIYFSPRQTYPYWSYDPNDPPTESTDDDIYVGYVSRMVGWYPKTYEVPIKDGAPADASFIEAGDTYRVIDGAVCVRFPNKLDGQTDVMMTDMREGRYDLRAPGRSLKFRNNDIEGHDYDVQPYGHQFANRFDDSEGYEYLNYFTFNHYLTGIRLYVRADKSDLSLISWKQIDDVIFTDQPSTVTISLPVRQARSDSKSTLEGLTDVDATLPIEGVSPVFGGIVYDETIDNGVILWEDEKDMPVIKTAMASASDYPKHPEFADTPSYPVMMENGVDLTETYLGYILARPDRETPFEIHTDAGVFSGKIPTTAKYTDANGNLIEDAPILKPGYIYKIVIDIKTDGSMDVIIGNEDTESFRDLAPYNEEITNFEYSNCYVITPDLMKKDDGTFYDGFYFQANTAGRGDLGALSVAGADLYPDELYFEPHSVRILWQDTDYLIRHVELVHGYVRFILNDECKTNGMTGNAVIAAYDENGDIIWSWHVWVAPSELTDISYSVNGRTFSMMNMNLGATAASPGSDPLDTYGLYYQWGRKDPLPVPPAYDYQQSDRNTKTYYYMDQGARNSVDIVSEAEPTVETGARHPLDIIASAQLGDYANDWLYNSIDNLWGYSASSGKVLRKTIYDPCPYGYRVPDDELQVLFEYCEANDNDGWWRPNNLYDAGDYGITIVDENGNISNGTDNFFPYSGWRGRDVGRTDRDNTWYMVGTLGDYQNARVDKNLNSDNFNHRGRTLLVRDKNITIPNPAVTYSGYIHNNWGNRSSSSPIRCIRYNDASNTAYPEEP